MNKTKKILLFFMLLCMVFSSFNIFSAEKKALITGTVKTEEGIPMHGVLIWISDTTNRSVTNSSGEYTLIPDKTGIILVNAYFKDLEQEIMTIQIKKGETAELNFILKPKKISYEISVSSDPPKLMSASENIGVISIKPDQVAGLPTLGEQDIFRSIQLMPGVSGSNESSSGLYVRGGKPEENLILYDGFTIYHVDHFFGIFSAFNANAIEEVKLYKGGFESKYGGRISSVMEIDGKTANNDGIKYGGGINFLSFNAFAEIPLGEKGGIYLAGRQSFQSPLYNIILNKFHDTDSPTRSTQSNSSQGGGKFAGMFDADPTSYFYDLNAKAIYKPSQKDVLSFSIYNGKDDLDNSREIEMPEFMQERAIERGFSIDIDGAYIDLNKWGNLGSSFNWLRQWNSIFSTNFTLAYSNYFNELEKISSMKMTRTDNTEEEIGEEANVRNTERISNENNNLEDMTFRINNVINLENNKLEFGFQVVKNKIDYNYSASNFVSTDDESVELPEPENLLNIYGSGIQYSGFLQDKVTLFNRITLTPGIRLTYFDQTEKFYIEPRFSLILNLSEKIKLKGSWGNYYQYVNNLIREDIMQGDKDFWVLSDDKNVPVSSATHYIAGISFETKKFLFDFEAYYKSLKDISQYSFRYTPGIKNSIEEIDYMDHFYQGTGYAKGMEFLIQKKYGRYTGWICYTLGKVEHDFPDLDENPFPASHDVTHEFKIVNSFKLKKWTLSSTFIYASGKPYTEPVNAYQETVYNEISNREMLVNIIEYGPKNGSRLPDYHRLDVSLTYDFKIGFGKASAGFSVFNLYNNKNIWRREYDVVENELIETDVNYLGITPSLFFKIRF